MSLKSLIETLPPGSTVFLPGSAGEPTGLSEALAADGAPALDITTTWVPGINTLQLDRLPAGSRVTGLFAHPASAAARERRTFRQLALSYGAFVKHLRERARFDATIVHVAPPDRNGLCSLGPAVEFTEIAVRRSARILAVINPRLPALRNSPSLPIAAFAATVEVDAPLKTYDVGTPSDQAAAIARHAAAFVGDRAVLQVGLGKVPDALMRCVGDRKGLRLHSGMLSDGARLLAEAGALDPDFAPLTCVGLGSAGFYDWLASRADLRVTGCDITHDPARLAALDGLVAVNSAISVDLLGQANLEMLDGRTVSGVGGAADFARGAALAPGGISIVALPTTGGRDRASRVVPALDGVASLPRHDIDVVVTEEGAADLRGLSLAERAFAIAGIAAPAHRSALEAAAVALAGRI